MTFKEWQHAIVVGLLAALKAPSAWLAEAPTRCVLEEVKAIECVRRRQRYLAQASQMEAQALGHAKLERQLSADLGVVQDKLNTLRQQRNIMRTRASRAEALRVVHSIDSSTIGEIDDIGVSGREHARARKRERTQRVVQTALGYVEM